MVKYVSSKDNLIVIMNLLRDKMANIQYEAFHVFKIFVANPNKPERVEYVFVKNGKKLASFLKRFQRERDEENEAFAAERQSLIDRINDIVDAANSTAQ